MISSRCFQIIPPYGGSMDDGPSLTYLSSRPTFRFPDIGYSGYCQVFQRNLSPVFRSALSPLKILFLQFLSGHRFRRPCFKLAEN